MGYTLKIGEAELDWDEEYGGRIVAADASHDGAPAFGEPTDGTNSRWPSYSSWHDFCANLGILSLMFDSRNGGEEDCIKINGKYISPLISEHPGHTVIQPEHLELLEEAVEKYKKAHPDNIAQYPPPLAGFEDQGIFARQVSSDPKYDGNLCRAEWLLYWMRWALKNCDKPIFYNS